MFEPDSIIGSYRIVRLLGEGGMGAVYEVEHLQLGVHYALKTFTLDDENRDLFLRRFAVEGRMLAILKHPNLTSVFDLQQDEATGACYYVMDLVLYEDGQAYTLADLDPGGADENQIFEWFCQLCDALAYIHGQGIVHRDIKLNNILIAPDRHVVLTDFGISRVCDDRLRVALNASRTMTSATGGHMVVGTQGYMAPEVLRGEHATPAADVYALGVVFFKLLTGVWYDPDLEPGVASTAGTTDARKLLSDFERPWRQVLPRMLATDPRQRPADLRNLPYELQPTDEAEAVPASSARRPRRVLTLVALGVTVLAVLSGLAVYLLGFKAETPPEEDDLLMSEAFSLPESAK